ncbi:MAG: hypothetical protein WBL93_13670 [Lutisporaceae bacterium]
MGLIFIRFADENSTCRKFRQTGADGKEYNANFYNLEAVIAVGFRTNSENICASQLLELSSY